MHSFLVSAAAFIVLIGIMVVVHEFGHFAVAKLCRVRVEAFSIGFGPRLFGVKWGETDYRICVLPFGGYVKMTGENPGEEQHEEDAAAFSSHPRWQRMLIGLAGPAANFALAFVLMLVYFGWINEVPFIKPATLEWVAPGSAADQAGLKPGDVIQQFGREQDPDLQTVLDVAEGAQGQTIPVAFTRSGQQYTSHLQVAPHRKDVRFALPNSGLYFHIVDSKIHVAQTVADSPAAQAGLKAGDALVSVDGYQFHTLDPLLDYLQIGAGKPITIVVERDGKTLPLVAHPAHQSAGWRLGFVSEPIEEPANTKMVSRPMSLGNAVTESSDFFVTNSTVILQVIEKLFTRQASVKELSGPVGIARVAGQAAEMKYWWPKVALAAGISLNLGILNLMPFPILDGGLILLLLIESALRHDISMVVKERIYQAAFVVLVMFFVYVSFNDVAKLSIFSKLKP